MNLQQAQDLCISLMNQNGLTKEKGWSFSWIKSKNSAGRCRTYGTSGGIIFLSSFITPIHSDTKVLDTILHEIAHGLTPGHRHDFVWQRKAIEIGSNGQRCFEASSELLKAKAEISKYIGTCPVCSKVFPKTRLPKRTSWCRCASKGFLDKNKLVFVENQNLKKSKEVLVSKLPTNLGKLPSTNDPYKKMYAKFIIEFLPLINNDVKKFEFITKNIIDNISWRTKNKETRRLCNIYMFENKLMTNAEFQGKFFYEGPMHLRSIHGKNAPWISGKPS